MSLFTCSPRDWRKGWEGLGSSLLSCYSESCLLSPLLPPLQDVARLQEGQQPEHQDVALQKVSDSEKLLYILDADAAIAKHMKHPQGDMIAEE